MDETRIVLSRTAVRVSPCGSRLAPSYVSKLLLRKTFTTASLVLRLVFSQKNRSKLAFETAFKVAGWTRLELATSCVTDRTILHNYQFIRKLCWKIVGCSPSKHMLFYLSINLANYLLIASKKSIFYSSFSVWFQCLYRKIVLV